ncbi:MAG: 30S ribosomal protein S12 methylthiotransferase RimO [Bacilli bacterium]|nr:30S ribosomal protein S12 methylthiotransferase RimO [Bacilli bacterium]
MRRMKIGFISLGCSKNLVVTEEMIGLFKKHGYDIVNNPEDADIILINTCGFIESAKDEGINTILEMAEYKSDKCKYLIVTGCLVERYKEELEKELPEVDLFVKISDYSDMWSMIEELVNKSKVIDRLDYKDRVITTGDSMAYLKIAEGCSNFCTYCAIPYIQGRYVSRPYEEILDEAKRLEEKGIKELVVIAQDTTKYGIDLYGKSRLAELLNDLCRFNFKWIRFLYSYPESIDDELIEVVKNNDKICSYFDLPIQHISNNVLKKMNRKSDKDSIINLINKLRKEIPDVVLRTTLIVGFPGETEEDFNELCKFVKESRFDRLGAFAYSKEDGTPAAKFNDQIEEKVKKSRRNKIMEIQQEVSSNLLRDLIGNEYEVLIENITENGDYFIARSYRDVPSEDGVIYVEYKEGIMINDFVKVKIIDSREYDLLAIVL